VYAQGSESVTQLEGRNPTASNAVLNTKFLAKPLNSKNAYRCCKFPIGSPFTSPAWSFNRTRYGPYDIVDEWSWQTGLFRHGSSWRRGATRNCNA
jgi:hypothetical protein